MVGLVFVCEDFAAFGLPPRFTEDFETEVVILLPFFGSFWYSDSYHKNGGREKRRKGDMEEGRNGRIYFPSTCTPFLLSSFFHFSSKSKLCNFARNA
jgi:hypothetical protein